MKRILSTIAIVIVFILGLSILLYPTISNWLNDQSHSYAMADYSQLVSNGSAEAAEAEFALAEAYNDSLTGDVDSLVEARDATELNSAYWDTLDVVDGIMGIIEIPAIQVSLPIYHGTDEVVLQKGVGHMEGSALPIGRTGDHTILTGHTGLPTATLFTDLDDLVLGDTFTISILNQVFTYVIFEINVVLPSEVDTLVAQPGRDLVTLVTCTPYGVNSHRLLIHGERLDGEVNTALDYTELSPLSTAPVTSVVPSASLSFDLDFNVLFLWLFALLDIILLLHLMLPTQARAKKRKQGKGQKKGRGACSKKPKPAPGGSDAPLPLPSE